MKFKVQISAGIRKDYVCDLTEREAIDICEENNWEYVDENGFVWSMDYVEDWGEAEEKSNSANKNSKMIKDRIKMVKAMEFVARQINDEWVFERWLSGGVADGDIEYGDLSVAECSEDDSAYYYVVDDDSFAELMGTFLRVISGAKKSGGLYCGNVVSKD